MEWLTLPESCNHSRYPYATEWLTRAEHVAIVDINLLQYG